jgi:hypothetical protein
MNSKQRPIKRMLMASTSVDWPCWRGLTKIGIGKMASVVSRSAPSPDLPTVVPRSAGLLAEHGIAAGVDLEGIVHAGESTSNQPPDPSAICR